MSSISTKLIWLNYQYTDCCVLCILVTCVVRDISLTAIKADYMKGPWTNKSPNEWPKAYRSDDLHLIFQSRICQLSNSTKYNNY